MLGSMVGLFVHTLSSALRCFSIKPMIYQIVPQVFVLRSAHYMYNNIAAYEFFLMHKFNVVRHT